MSKYISAVNALSLKQAGVQLYDFELQTFNITPRMFLNDVAWDRVNDLISAKLDIFAAELGYPHSITNQDVINYMERSARLFGILRQILRQSNVRNLRTLSGSQKLGELLSNCYQAFNNGTRIEKVTEFIGTDTNKIKRKAVYPASIANMSNAHYSALIGEAVGLIYAPLTWLNTLDYLMSSYFQHSASTDKGSDSLFAFQMLHAGIDYENENFLTIVRTMMSTLQVDLVSNPLLITFFERHMQITNFATAWDFTRDLSKTTILIVEDLDLHEALETSLNVWGIANDNIAMLGDVELIYSDPGVMYSILYAPMQVSFDTERLLYKFIMCDEDDNTGPNDAIRATFVKAILFSTSNYIEMVNNVTGITLTLLNPDTSSNQVGNTINNINYHSKVANDSRQLFAPPVTLEVFIDGDEISNSGFLVDDSVNLFMMNEDDFVTVQADTQLEFIFGLDTEFTYPGMLSRISTEPIKVGKQTKSTTNKEEINETGSNNNNKKRRNSKRNSNKNNNNKPDK